MFTTKQAKAVTHLSEGFAMPDVEGDLPSLLRPWLDRLDRLPAADEIGLERAVQVVAQIEQSAAPRLAQLTHHYLSTAQQLEAIEEDDVWQAVNEYLEGLARSYRWCLHSCWGGSGGTPPGLVALIASCAMHACAARLKWSYLRDLPITAQQWSEMAEIFARAESGGVAKTEVELPSSGPRRSSVEQQLLKALALAAGFPSGMMSAQIDIADRLIGFCAPQLALAPRSGTPAHYFFDLAGERGPQRLASSTRMPDSARGIVLARAASALKQVTDDLDSGLLTGVDLNLGGNTFDPELTGATARHLLHYWGQMSRERRSVRRQENSRLAVVHGFDAVAASVVGADVQEPITSEPEYWLARDRSDTGFRAQVGEDDGKWLQVGSLMAFRYSSLPMWHAGIVRRVRRGNQAVREVGVEKMVTGTAPVRVRRRFRGADDAIDTGSIGMLLVDPSGPRESISLLLPAGTFSPTAPLEMLARDTAYLLIPLEVGESGPGYQIARFKLIKPVA